MEHHPDNGSASERQFVRRSMIVIVLAALVAAVWALADILLLIFGAVLLALMLRAIADPITKHGRIPESFALAIVVLGIIGVVAAGVMAFGPELTLQMRGLFERLPQAFAKVAEEFQLGSFMDLLSTSSTASSVGNMLSRVFAWSTSALGALASIALVIAGGIYMAADSKLYIRGFIKLFPPAVHPNVTATLDDAGEALRRWLGAQLVAMVVVGTLTGIGLSMIGVPNAFALGLIVGLADFVPVVGPIFAAIPIILVASMQNWQTVVWAIAVILIVQQIESIVVVPLVTGRMVSMAPVVGLFSVVALGVLFGPLGLLFGFPLAIVIDVAVRRLYVLDSLGESVEILGEPAERSQP